MSATVPAAPWVLREAGMRRLGAVLGAAVMPGDVVALDGPLGAGKSVLARALARGAGVPDEVRVTSPTFAVVLEYGGRIPVHHADLYRLAHADELLEIGLVERAADAVLVVEWASRMADARPADTLWIDLAPCSPTERAVTLRAGGDRASALAAAAGAWARRSRSIPRA